MRRRADMLDVIFIERPIETSPVVGIAGAAVANSCVTGTIGYCGHYQLELTSKVTQVHAFKAIAAMVNALAGARLTSLDGIPEELHYVFKKVE
jgi:hypothetical protein